MAGARGCRWKAQKAMSGHKPNTLPTDAAAPTGTAFRCTHHREARHER